MQSIKQYRKVYQTIQSITHLESQTVGNHNAIDPHASTDPSGHGDKQDRDANIHPFTHRPIPAPQNTREVAEGEQRSCGSKDCAAGMHDLEKQILRMRRLTLW